MVIDQALNKVYITGAYAFGLFILDGTGNTLTVSIPGDYNPNIALALNPTTHKVFVLREGTDSTTNDLEQATIAVFDATTGQQLTARYAGYSPFKIAVDQAADTVYALNANSTSSTISPPSVTVMQGSSPWNVIGNDAGSR